MTRGPPVSTLLPNGVFIDVVGYWLTPGAPSSFNRVVDGHRATVQPVPLPSRDCPTGTTGAQKISIFLPSLNVDPPGSGTTIVMAACYSGPESTPTAHDVDAMFDSVRFT